TLAPGRPVRVEQFFDAEPFRGKTVRVRAAVRGELPEGSHAALWLSVDRPNQEPGFVDPGNHPFGSGPWRTVEITGDVAPDAVWFSYGLTLEREGKVWIDDVALEIVGPAGENYAVNPSFEVGEPGWQPDGWDLAGGLQAAGYSWTRSAESPHSGQWCGLLA